MLTTTRGLKRSVRPPVPPIKPMATLWLLSRFQYDGHIKTVPADTDFTMDEFAAFCAQFSIGHHVQDQPGETLRVRPTSDGDDAEPYPREMQLKDAKPALWDCFDIYFEHVRAHGEAKQ